MQQVIPQGCCPRLFCYPYSVIPSIFLPPFSSGHTKFPGHFPARAGGTPWQKYATVSLLAYAKEWQDLLWNKMQYGLATAKQHHWQQQLQRGRWSMGDADKKNQWQGVGEDKQTMMEGWLETTGQSSTQKEQAENLHYKEISHIRAECLHLRKATRRMIAPKRK